MAIRNPQKSWNSIHNFYNYDVIKIRLGFNINAGQMRRFSCVMLNILDLLALIRLEHVLLIYYLYIGYLCVLLSIVCLIFSMNIGISMWKKFKKQKNSRFCPVLLTLTVSNTAKTRFQIAVCKGQGVLSIETKN